MKKGKDDKKPPTLVGFNMNNERCILLKRFFNISERILIQPVGWSMNAMRENPRKRLSFLLSSFFLVVLVFLSACGGGGGTSGGGSGAVTGSGIVVTGTLDSQSIQVAEIPGFLNRLYALISPRSAQASVQTITNIIARSTDGSTTETATISGSNFSISLPPGKTYLILLLDGTTTVGTLTVDPTSGMAIIPVSTSSQSFSLGTVSLSGSTATPTISESQLLTSLGINTTEAATLATYTQSVTWLENGDVDGDGILDYKENRLYKFFIEYWFGTGCTSGCSNPPGGPMFVSAEKAYSPTPNFSTMDKSYNYDVIEAGTSLSSMPTFDTTGLNNNSCVASPNIVLNSPSSVVAYGNRTTSIDICSYNNSSNGVSLTLNGQSLVGEFYEFDAPSALRIPITIPTTPPPGTYTMTGTGTSNCPSNGCKLTFTNVSSISLTNLKNIFFPSIEMTMSGSTVTGFSWQWYEYDFSTGSWIKPTLAVLQSVLTESMAEFGDINDSGKIDVPIGITPSGTATVSNTGCNTTSSCVRLSLQYGDIGGYIYQWGDF